MVKKSFGERIEVVNVLNKNVSNEMNEWKMDYVYSLCGLVHSLANSR